MKKRDQFLICSLAVLACLLAVMMQSALAQTGGGYDLAWNTLEGGGMPVSTGGDYILTGTFGQSDAGAALSGDGYKLDGGFWNGSLSYQINLPLITRE
jgi:hypothetical protein